MGFSSTIIGLQMDNAFAVKQAALTNLFMEIRDILKLGRIIPARTSPRSLEILLSSAKRDAVAVVVTHGIWPF